jgi:hypothetical protein
MPVGKVFRALRSLPQSAVFEKKMLKITIFK